MAESSMWGIFYLYMKMSDEEKEEKGMLIALFWPIWVPAILILLWLFSFVKY
jgi:hypothetical protein